jgi:hypothetical protein
MSRTLPLAGDLPATAAPRPALPTARQMDELERHLNRSPAVAWGVIAGLPVVGVVTSLFFGLSPFAALLTGSFLLATSFVLVRAMVRFTSQVMRLLVAARLVVALLVGALLFWADGNAWAALVSAVLFWLVADRLLGRIALNGMTQLRRKRR